MPTALLDVDDKAVACIYGNLDAARAKLIQQKWHDVEADEVDLVRDRKHQDCLGAVGRPRRWGAQTPCDSSGSIQMPPIRNTTESPLQAAQKNGTLHTDGARAYKIKLDKAMCKKLQVAMNSG